MHDTPAPDDDPAQRVRGPMPRWALLAVACAVIAVAGAVAWFASRTSSAPVAPAVEVVGLPDPVVAGQQYPVRIRVQFPDSWPMEHRTEDDASPRALFGAAGRGTPEDDAFAGLGETDVIFCSTGVLDATGQTVDLDCPVTAPAAVGEPWSFRVGVNAPGDQDWDFTYEFLREVRAP